MKRKVNIFEMTNADGRLIYKIGEGTFHEFVHKFIMVGDLAKSEPTAIIEMDDGIVKNIPISLIQFQKQERTFAENHIELLVDRCKKLRYTLAIASSIFYHGKFIVETPNEKLLKDQLIELGMFANTEDELMDILEKYGDK